MERLTIKHGDGQYTFHKPVNISGNEYLRKAFNEILKRLGEYEDLEEQKKLLKLPCKAGDTIYAVCRHEIIPIKVYEINTYCLMSDLVTQINCYRDNWSVHFWVTDIGKTVFLTQAEAEAVL